MKKMAFAAMAVAAAALVSGNVAAQDTGAGASSTATAPPATMQPIPNPPEKAAMSHGAKHRMHHAMKKHASSMSSKSSMGATGSDTTTATPAPQQ